MYKINISIYLENIGKIPAFRVTRSWLFLQFKEDHKAFVENMQEFRDDIDHRMNYMGMLMLPGDERKLECTIDITPEDVVKSERFCGLADKMLLVGFKYYSQATGNTHEAGFIYNFSITDSILPLDIESQRNFPKNIVFQHLPVFDIIA